jgi:hypothetical protein
MSIDDEIKSYLFKAGLLEGSESQVQENDQEYYKERLVGIFSKMRSDLDDLSFQLHLTRRLSSKDYLESEARKGTSKKVLYEEAERIAKLEVAQQIVKSDWFRQNFDKTLLPRDFGDIQWWKDPEENLILLGRECLFLSYTLKFFIAEIIRGAVKIPFLGMHTQCLRLLTASNAGFAILGISGAAYPVW